MQPHISNYYIIFKLGFIPCKAEQPLRGMKLQEKKDKKTETHRKSVFQKPTAKKGAC